MSVKSLKKFITEELMRTEYFHVYGFTFSWIDIVILLRGGGEKKCASAEDDRGTISLEKINQYIKEILEVIPLIKNLRLLINMDESGFGQRPDYKKRRSCVYSGKLNIKPLWRAATDKYHISWICGITAAATALRHMFTTARINMDPDFDQTFIIFPKSYMI